MSDTSLCQPIEVITIAWGSSILVPNSKLPFITEVCETAVKFDYSSHFGVSCRSNQQRQILTGDPLGIQYEKVSSTTKHLPC
eukprot:4267612-Amphidinium_carterae.1